jgi:hypothetical protein
MNRDTMRSVSILFVCLFANIFCSGLQAQRKSYVPSSRNLMIVNGLKFMGTPYVAHTLEINSPAEKLVVNLRGVDCTTFVEYVLALSLCKKQGDSIQFLSNLKRIRYRNGKIDGYTSRLHYSTEWALNGIHSGFLIDEAAIHSKDAIKVELSFMSTHPQSYPQLSSSPSNVQLTAQKEKELTGTMVHYVPKAKLPAKGLKWIHNGDIILLVTSIPGLDNSHLGIAIYKKGELHLLHASSLGGKVKIQEEPLSAQLAKGKSYLGIRVLRMKK